MMRSCFALLLAVLSPRAQSLHDAAVLAQAGLRLRGPGDAAGIELAREARVKAAQERVLSEAARSHFYVFDEKLYGCWSGPPERLSHLQSYFKSYGMPEEFFAKRMKMYSGTCDEICMRNGWKERRSCIRNVRHCRNMDMERADEYLGHKLQSLAEMSHSTRAKMVEMLEGTDVEKACMPNSTTVLSVFKR